MRVEAVYRVKSMNKSRPTQPPSGRRRFGGPRRSAEEATPSGGGRPRRPQRKILERSSLPLRSARHNKGQPRLRELQLRGVNGAGYEAIALGRDQLTRFETRGHRVERVARGDL